jgi:hypothetical protein
MSERPKPKRLLSKINISRPLEIKIELLKEGTKPPDEVESTFKYASLTTLQELAQIMKEGSGLGEVKESVEEEWKSTLESEL